MASASAPLSPLRRRDTSNRAARRGSACRRPPASSYARPLFFKPCRSSCDSESSVVPGATEVVRMAPSTVVVARVKPPLLARGGPECGPQAPAGTLARRARSAGAGRIAGRVRRGPRAEARNPTGRAARAASGSPLRRPARDSRAFARQSSSSAVGRLGGRGALGGRRGAIGPRQSPERECGEKQAEVAESDVVVLRWVVREQVHHDAAEPRCHDQTFYP